MNVIVNNYKCAERDCESTKLIKPYPIKPYPIKPYPRRIICDVCSSELEYEKADMTMGVLGCMHIDCPLCSNSIMLEENEDSITLTKDNIEFPVHFFHTSKESGAVENCNTENIRRYVSNAIKFLRENKDEYYWSARCGNLYVAVTKSVDDEDYEVTVSNDYFTTYIPFQSADY